MPKLEVFAGGDGQEWNEYVESLGKYFIGNSVEDCVFPTPLFDIVSYRRIYVVERQGLRCCVLYLNIVTESSVVDLNRVLRTIVEQKVMAGRGSSAFVLKLMGTTRHEGGFVQALWAATLATIGFVDAQKYSRRLTSVAHLYCFSRYHGMKELASLPSISCEILQALGYSCS
ncbi:hypothetical protein ISCGN_010085 [Ixodes scapularis]